jgi:uncharacterized protein
LEVFPEVVIGAIEPKSYLATLFDSILLKDVVKRYKIRFAQKIYNLALYLISNFSSEFSFNKLKNVLAFRSTNTVESYLNYLEEAYIVFSLNRFSFKTKDQIKAPRKIYLIDNGFVLAKSFQFSQNVGKLMENLVFVDILRRGYTVNKDIFYYKTKNGKEVDFILREGFKITKLIQVSFEINDMKIKEREINALIEASEELNCDELLIITWDTEKEEKIKDKKIKFIPLWKWLLEKTLDS